MDSRTYYYARVSSRLPHLRLLEHRSGKSLPIKKAERT